MAKSSVKDLTKKALMSLMDEKAFVDITISDIINTAGIARVSFYRNYHSITDVIDEISRDMTAHFIEEVHPVLASKDEHVWREFLFKHFRQFSEQHKTDSPYKFTNGHVLFSRVNLLMQEIEKQNPSSTIPEKYSTFAKMGLINNIIKKWLDEGQKETPEEMIDYIMSFILLF